MSTLQYAIQSATPLTFPVIAAVGAAISAARHRSRAIEIWQRWWLICAAGCGAAWVGVSFLLAGDYMADAIGFGVGSPFQFEIAFANFGFAALGILLAFRHKEFRLAYGIGYAIFLWGAAIGHVVQWFAHGDHAPGNTGGILLVDIGVPLVIVVLALIDRRSVRAVSGVGTLAA